jgi:hypothetical protein
MKPHVSSNKIMRPLRTGLCVFLLMSGLAGLRSWAATPLPNELLHIQFEEGSGTTAADSSTNAVNGTLSGTPLPNWIAPGCQGLGALEFFGSGSARVSVGNPTSLQLTGAVTLAAWVNPDSVSSSGKILTKLAGTRGYSISVENIAPSGQWTFQIASSSSAFISCRTPNDAPAIGQWTHLAGVYDPNDTGGPSMKIYLNGQLAVTTNSGTVPAQQYSLGNNVNIGIRPDGINQFDGKIDEVRIFGRALSQAEIQALPELQVTPLAFGIQPVSRTIVENNPVTFQTTFTGSGPYTVNWYENNVLVSSTNTLKWTVASVQTSMNNYTYKVEVSNSVYRIVSTNAVLKVSTDSVRPQLVSAGSVDGNTIGLCFSEPMDPNTFNNASYFTVNGGAVTVGSSYLRTDGSSATLYLNTPISAPFSVQVTGVTDLVGNPIVTGAAASGTVGGLTATDLGSTAPGETFSCATNSYEITAGGADIWGASDNGHYAYRSISGDFDVRVNLTSITPVDVSSKAGIMVRINTDSGSPTLHILANAPLTSGGGGNITAGVRGATGGGTAYIGTVSGAVSPNQWLRLRRWNEQFTAFYGTDGANWTVLGAPNSFTFSNPLDLGLVACSHTETYNTVAKFQNYENVVFSGVSLSIPQPPANLTTPQNSTASFSVQAQGTGAAASELLYQWQRSDGAGGFTNIIFATHSSYSFTARAADNGAQFRVIVYFAGLTQTSSVATLTLTHDDTLPAVLSVSSVGDPNFIKVVFSKDLDPVSAQTAGNYPLAGGGTPPTVTTAVLSADARTVLLTTSAPLTEGPTYTLTIQNVKDLAVPANTIVTTAVPFNFSTLLGYWKFEEGTGTTTADSGPGGFTGTLLNGPTWVSGAVGHYALQFDGSNDRVDIGNPAPFQMTGPMTISAWVYPFSIGDSGRIVSKQGGNGSRGWSLNTESANTWTLQVAPSLTSVFSCSYPGVALNTWTHLTGVYDPYDQVNGPIMKLYLNGVMVTNVVDGVPNAQTDSGLNVAIGSRPTGDNRFNGVIDEVRVYSRALSDAEVAVIALPAPVFLPPVLSGNQLTLTWSGGGQLQSAPLVTGTYTNITPTPSSPYTTTVAPGQNKFFRVLRQ